MKQKFYKLLSIVLTLSLALTCCMAAFNATAEETETEQVYFYVNPTSTGGEAVDGITPATAVPTIVDAINKAKAYDSNSDGIPDFGEDDIVYIRLIKAFQEDGKTEIWQELYPTGVTDIPTHDFKLDIASNDAQATIKMYSAVTLQNDTKFTNLVFAFESGFWRNLIFNSHNISFGPNVIAKNSGNIQFAAFAKSAKQPDELNYSFESFPFGFYLGPNYGSYPVCNNINITLDNGVSGTFLLGDRGDIQALRLITFNGNLNFNIKNAKSLNVKDAKDDTPLAFTSNFAAQFINSTGNVTLTDTAVNYFSGKTIKDTTDPVKYFVINNSYGADAIEFTKTAGKFAINSKFDPTVYDIALISADGTIKENLDSDGYITVTKAGVYNLQLTKKPNLSATYYVGPDGDDSNFGTQDKPFASVNAAIKYANDKGYGLGDKVYIKVISGTVPWTSGSGVMVDHDYLLNISSLTSTRATIGETYVGFTVNGDVELENIVINGDGKTVDGSNKYSLVNFNGQNVSIGEKVNFQGWKWDIRLVNGGTFENEINLYLGSGLTYNNTAFKSMPIGGYGDTATFKKDINITIDNTSYYSGKAVNPMSLGGNKTTTFYGNINFNIKQAKGLDISEGSKATYSANTSIQFINSANANLTTTKTNLAVDTDFVNEAGNKVPVYIINNNSGNADAISFTETAGKYKYNLDANIYNVSIEKVDDASVKGELVDGYITVPEAGEYNFSITRITNYSVTYFVSPNGNDTNSGKTENEALATIHGVISAANKAGYGTSDTVYAKLIKTTVTDGETTSEVKHEWYPTGVTTLPEYDFKLDISSLNDRATINMYYGDGIHLTGDTDFDNVILAFKTEKWPVFSFGSHNVSMGSKVDYENSVFNNYILASEADQPKDINLCFGSALPNTFRLGGMYINPTFKNINITLDNKTASSFALGCQDDARVITFDGNLNFNLKNSAGINLATTKDNETGPVPLTFTSNFAAQFINSTGKDALTDNAVEYFKSHTVSGTDTALPYYVINNNTGNKDAIKFTATAGVFEINGLTAGKSLWVYNKDGKFIKKAANNSTVKLEPGEYYFNIGVGSADYSYEVQEGTSIADAIQSAIDDGAESGDSVTFNVLADTNFGVLPEYKFNLVIQSEDKVTITVDNGLIANNAGMTTEYKNVVINNPAEYGSFQLAHSNAIFHKDASFVGSNSKLIFGYNNIDPTTEILHDQTVEINCKTPPNISLSNGINTRKEYSKDVNLIINNKDASTKLFFNAYYEGAAHYTTKYNGNVNINIKDAKTITLESGWDSNISFGDNSHIQFMIDGSTDFDYATLATKLTDNNLLDKATIIVDNTFQRRCVDFTKTAGVFAIDNPYKVTATKTQTISSGAFTEISDSNKVVKTVENNQFTADFGGDVWELTSNEYFEDFNNTTLEELKANWIFTGRVSSETYLPNPTTLTEDGRLLIGCSNYVMEYGDPNKNYNLKSKDQFISVDLQPKDFGLYNGFAIFGRMEGKKGYELRLCATDQRQLKLYKYDGEDRSASGEHYATNLDGLEYEGLMEYRPGDNSVSFDADHIYRMSLGITTDYDAEGNEIALIRCIFFDITSNTLLFDETFRDNNPYTGTECAIYSPHGAEDGVLALPYIDNFYFSTEKFREGDDGWCENDINGDGVYDIRDLVMTNDSLGDTSQTMLYKADRDLSGTINDGDITIVRKELLGGLSATAKKEFNLKGQSDEVAETTRQNILNSTSSYNTADGTYTSSATVRENGEYVTKTTTYGNGSTIYFVANNAAGSGTGTSENDAMSLDTFITNLNADRDTYSSAIVLFKRGETYRIATDKLILRSEGTYAYFVIPAGTTAMPTVFGAYGTGAKPRFTSSLKEYATDVTWTEVGGKNANVWVIDAPEFYLGDSVKDNAPTNIIFNGGDSVGLRKGFPVGIDPQGEKLYTLYKEGDFTYDEVNKKLYLYSVGNPSKYSSIEVSRGIMGIALPFGASDFVIDNLNLHGFGKFAIQGGEGNNNLTVTNCEIGFAGGVKNTNTADEVARYANAIEFWEGGANFHVNYNWIYHTWDSAITTQSSSGDNHNGMQIKGNLLEYNNADIEIFDRANTGTNKPTRDDTEWTDNIMRFTALGWGSRNVSRIRNIQGVIRGSVTACTVVSIDWTHNIVDTPGMEFARFTNLTEYTTNSDGVNEYTGIFKFGQSYNSSNPSELGNNTYYFNPYVRSRTTTLWQYHDAVPSGGIATNPKYGVTTKTEFYDVMTKFDNSSSSQFYFLGERVTSGS